MYLSTCISGGYQVKFERCFFSRVIHIEFLMWILGMYFQVYSTWIVSRGLLVYPFTWISVMDIMRRVPPDFVSHVSYVYFSNGLLVYLPRVYLVDIM